MLDGPFSELGSGGHIEMIGNYQSQSRPPAGGIGARTPSRMAIDSETLCFADCSHVVVRLDLSRGRDEFMRLRK